jgi:uncharacterized protein DUF2752
MPGMDAIAVPLIFSPPVRPQSLGWTGRILALLLSASGLAGLITAALLTPNPGGLGTHTALGFAPCSWLRVLGFPCPFCGMTTSWAWFARGNLAASLWVQPMGTVLAIIAVVVFWGGLYVALTGRPAHRLLRYLPSGYIPTCLLAAAALAWGWKIFIQAYHLDGWH